MGSMPPEVAAEILAAREKVIGKRTGLVQK
jgi:hypothetical protein